MAKCLATNLFLNSCLNNGTFNCSLDITLMDVIPPNYSRSRICNKAMTGKYLVD